MRHRGLLLAAALCALLGIVCVLLPLHIGMTGLCLLLLAAVLAALYVLRRKNAPRVWSGILIVLTALSMAAVFRWGWPSDRRNSPPPVSTSSSRASGVKYRRTVCS